MALFLKPGRMSTGMRGMATPASTTTAMAATMAR